MLIMLNISINRVVADKKFVLDTQLSTDNIRRRMNKQPVINQLTNLISNFTESLIRAVLGVSDLYHGNCTTDNNTVD